MKYLLIGNPNVGKSSLFNTLTNSQAHIGNWGGVTVEKKVGQLPTIGEIIDLPGTYSVIPNSEDEGVVTFALMNEHYNGIINVIDGTHIKRNLHLTIQLLESKTPLFLAINMMDEVEKSAKKINLERLKDFLGVEVYPISVKANKGIGALKDGLLNLNKGNNFKVNYGELIENAISKIEDLLVFEKLHIDKRWLAIQLLEGNIDVLQYLQINIEDNVKQIIQDTEQKVISDNIAFSLKGAIFNARHAIINEIIVDCVETTNDVNKIKSVNNTIDRFITNPFIGISSFILVMFLVYYITFDAVGAFLSDSIEFFIENNLNPFMIDFLTWAGIDGHFLALIIDGIIAGVGGVIVFVPQIAIMFLLLSIIEGTGYMARIAMVLDNTLSKFGLNGKSIVPMITGFGCNVPAIMATRTINNFKERLVTILIIPFMSCPARIPVYALLASMFFEENKALIIMSIYLLGIFVALLTSKLLSTTIIKTEDKSFILEIPPYRVPHWESVWRQTYVYTESFVKRAGKYILIGTIILWALQYAGLGGLNVNPDESFLASISGLFAPIFEPLGFGTWRATSGLIVGFLAKEFVLSAMEVLYGNEALVGSAFTAASAYSFMVFTLLYVPCLATVGVIKTETKSTKWTIFSVVYSFVVAYILSFIVYNILLIAL